MDKAQSAIHRNTILNQGEAILGTFASSASLACSIKINTEFQNNHLVILHSVYYKTLGIKLSLDVDIVK